MTIRRLARLLLVGAALAAVPVAPAAAMPAEARTADLDRFFHALAPYGDWVSIQPYGTVWIPKVSETWRPYERGRWTYAGRHGWYWKSREPWAWATYHYGGWVHTSRYGWAWVPGRVWAPAWVVWRTGGGHIGWAPAAPQGFPAPRLPDTAWVFVREPDFLTRDIAAVAALPEDTPHILSQATRSGSVQVSGSAGVNTFIDRDVVTRSTGYELVPRSGRPAEPPAVRAGFPERIYPPADIPSLPPARGLPDDDIDEPYLAHPRYSPDPEPEFESSPGRAYPTRPDGPVARPEPWDLGERGPAAALPRDGAAAPERRARVAPVPPAGDAATDRPQGTAKSSSSAAPKPARIPPDPTQARLPAAPGASPASGADPSAREAIQAAPPPASAQPPAPAQPSPPAAAAKPSTRAAQRAEPEVPATDGRKPCTPEQAKVEAQNCRPVRVIR